MNIYLLLLTLVITAACSQAPSRKVSSETPPDKVTLYMIKSPKGINWKSPWSLTYSTLKNSLVKYKNKRAFPISHVFIKVQCNSSQKTIFRGMTSASDSEERHLLFNEKYGLGLMFHTYEGKLEKDEEIEKDLAPYAGDKRMAKMTTLISPAACERMLEYAADYEARDFGKKYAGLQADPLEGGGSGCSAFGASFLEVGGVLEESFHTEWREHINVPKRFVGGPLTGNKTKLMKLITSFAAKWSIHEPNLELNAWNPEKIHGWINDLQRRHSYGEQIENLVGSNLEGETAEIIFDKRHYPVPQGRYWKFEEQN